MTLEQRLMNRGGGRRRTAGVALAATVGLVATALSAPAVAKDAPRPGPVEMVGDLNPTGHLGVEAETVWQESLLFFAGAVKRSDRLVQDGTIWRTTSRGTPARIFTDPPFDESSVRALQSFGDRFFLSAAPKGSPSGVRELWVSDGSDAGTERLTFHEDALDPEGLSELTVIDGSLYFTMEDRDLADRSTVNEDVWVSDGTPGGTRKLVDFGDVDEPMYGAELVKFGDRIVVIRNGDEGEGTLAITDGTTEGTQVLDHGGGQDTDGGPADATVSGDYLYYVNDRDGRGRALYRTDGTLDGTRQVEVGTSGRTLRSALVPLRDGRLVFRTARPTPALWVTDGTSKGTKRLKEFPGAERSQSREVAARTGKHVVFSVSSTQSQMWRTDGTKAGTKQLTSFTRGDDGVQISPYGMDLVAQGSRVFFTAETDGHGAELWSTDATVAGTGRVTDVAAGPADSNPQHLISALDRVWFLASEPTHQQELWRTLPDGPVAVARVKAKTRQKQTAKPEVQVKAGAAERARIVAKGELRLPGVKRTITLAKAKAVVPADKRRVFTLAVKKRDRAKVLKAVRAYRSAPKAKKRERAVNATVTVTFRGYAGNVTTRTVKIRLT